MSVENPQKNIFDAEEMKLFGLDPSSETAREEWLDTMSASDNSVTMDYSRDAFEFDGVSGEQNSEEVETE